MKLIRIVTLASLILVAAPPVLAQDDVQRCPAPPGDPETAPALPFEVVSSSGRIGPGDTRRFRSTVRILKVDAPRVKRMGVRSCGPQQVADIRGE